MDFFNLGENSPVYIIRKKPFEMLDGTLKSKSAKQQNPFIPQTSPQPIDIVVTVGGSDEVVAGVPQGTETVEYRGSYYSTTSQGIQQALANMMQIASQGKAEQPYYDTVLEKGEAYMEKLNPKYAEEKRQTRTINELVEHRKETDAKLDQILAFMKELSGPSKK